MMKNVINLSRIVLLSATLMTSGVALAQTSALAEEKPVLTQLEELFALQGMSITPLTALSITELSDAELAKLNAPDNETEAKIDAILASLAQDDSPENTQMRLKQLDELALQNDNAKALAELLRAGDDEELLVGGPLESDTAEALLRAEAEIDKDADEIQALLDKSETASLSDDEQARLNALLGDGALHLLEQTPSNSLFASNPIEQSARTLSPEEVNDMFTDFIIQLDDKAYRVAHNKNTPLTIVFDPSTINSKHKNQFTIQVDGDIIFVTDEK